MKSIVVLVAFGIILVGGSWAARADNTRGLCNSIIADGLGPGRAIAGTLGRSGRVLLTTQVALSMVLLVGAGLFTSTLSRLRANDTSLYTGRIVWTRLARTPGDREPIGGAYLKALLQQLEGLQGADAAALSVYYPAALALAGELPTDRYSRPRAAIYC